MTNFIYILNYFKNEIHINLVFIFLNTIYKSFILNIISKINLMRNLVLFFVTNP